ncbi:hypothetical protein COZ55_01025 [archaeon CG_4_8_14_3_um_filter_38_5]|nr:MAG: hypothetical protein COZ55_01025 [archaeon CG_4_8_14_3_um_filter_38_5]
MVTENEQNKEEKNALKELRPVIILIVTLVAAILIVAIPTFVQNNINLANSALMNSAFFTILGTIVYVIGSLIMFTVKPIQVNEKGEVEKEKTPEGVDVGGNMLLYRVGRIVALGAFLLVNEWIFLVSPFSLVGGSWYGFFMQIMIVIPLFFLLVNFWVNGITAGLYGIAIVSVLMFPLSFMFPTLFSNFYALTTGASATTGGTLMANFAQINPMSYYKSSILSAGTTEPVVGPTYEEVTDDVVGVDVSVGGRMCDSNDLVATVSVDNEAKYKLSDVFVQVSAIRNVYSFNIEDFDLFDVCRTDFDPDTDDRDLSSTQYIKDLPKGAPSTKTFTFQTELSPDILSQICSIRTDVVLAYHTTSVFPLTFMDYNAYQLSPANIGNPVSTSSFGKVRVDMDVGQQPVPYNEGNGDTLLLKVGWEQKSAGIVNNPTIFLFLPGDLGSCEEDVDFRELYDVGAGLFSYSGSITDASRFEEPDFECHVFDESEETIEQFCEDNFVSTVEASGVTKDALAAVSHFDVSALNMSDEITSSLNVPGIGSVCEDLVGNKGYTLCKTRLNPSTSEVLLCTLELTGIDVSEVDMNTYLIRADAVYDFHDVTTTTFTVENCDAI